MDSPQLHYATLFRDLEAEFGVLDAETLTSIVGFSAGGPVSLRQIARRHLFVTCELSLYPEQLRSAEGLKFELLSARNLSAEACRKLFTALGNLSFNAQLGHGHTVDVSQVVAPGIARSIRLQLHSQTRTSAGKIGIYEIIAHA
jgi:hypothetical protein